MPKETNLYHEAARGYVALGLAPIPLQPHRKIPLESGWERFSERVPTLEQVDAWWDRYPAANVGLVTGRAPRVFVLDVDGDLGRQTLEGRPVPLTARSRTGSGGEHIFFRYPDGVDEVRNRVGFLPGLDIRGDRGQVVAPPSVHPNGEPYEWLVHPDEVAPADAPEWLLSYLPVPGRGPGRAGRQGEARQDDPDAPAAWLEALWRGVDEGKRNDTMARVAGRYVALLGESEALGVCLAINEARFRPPLGIEEVEQVVISIGRAERRKSESREYDPAQVEAEAGGAEGLSDEQRAVARDAVSTALGVRLEAAYKYRTDPPSFELQINGARVEFENVDKLLEQRPLQHRIAAATGQMTRWIGKDRWPSVAQALLHACEDREVEEGTTLGALVAWLSGFLQDYPPDTEDQVADGKDTPFWGADGALYLNSTALRLWLRYRLDEKESSGALATKLRSFGAESVQVGRRTRGGGVRNVRFWRLGRDRAERLGVDLPRAEAA